MNDNSWSAQVPTFSSGQYIATTGTSPTITITNGTALTANSFPMNSNVFPTNVFSQMAPPVVPESPLDWLERTIREVCDLAEAA